MHGSAARSKVLTLLAQCAMLLLIGVASDQKFRDLYGSPSPLLAILAWQPSIVRGLLAGALASTGYLFFADRAAIIRAFNTAPQRTDVHAHFLLALVLLVGSAWAPALHLIDDTHTSWAMAFYLASPVLWAGYLFTGYRLAVPRKFLASLPLRNNVAIVTGVTLVAIGGWRYYEALSFPGSAQLTELSIYLASGFSSLAGHPIRPIGMNDVGWPIYRTGQFNVVIAPTCAGSEGLALISGLLLLLVYLERRTLRVPLALALVVVAAITMFIVNALRIAALLYIGDHWSPEVAVNGFHANFGLVALIVISTGFAFVIRAVAGQARPNGAFPRGESHDTRLVMPLMAMIAATLVIGLASGAFNWFYPVTTIIVATTLWRLRLPGEIGDWELTLPPLAAGFLVLVLWVMLIPADPDASATFSRTLFTAPVALSSAWLACRVIGSAVVVPIAEELAFRSFMLPWLSDLFARRMPHATASIAAVLVSSLAFGMAHSHILPGFLAGVAYGVVYLHRRNRFDAILAHGTTNLSLCLYAMAQGYWSYL